MKIKYLFRTVLGMTFLITSAISCKLFSHKQQNDKNIEIRGIYGNPDAFWKKGLNLNGLGVNAVFVHAGSINYKMLERARMEGMKVYAEFPTLNGKNYVDKHPEAWAIDEKGKKVQAASWFMGVCATEPGFRQYRIAQLKELLGKYDIDGVWMDYLHWHAQFEDPEPILPETCFCNHCLHTFQKTTGIKLPEGTTAEKAELILTKYDREWRSWRCSVIADWTKDFKMIIKESKQEVLLGIYHCPWDDDDYNGARRWILGLDYDLLKEHVDVFSPMLYHGRMGRSPEWVMENIEWFSEQLNIKPGSFPKVWPIVQAHNDPYNISAEEFENVLRYGLSGEATGVMMFTSYSVAEDHEKTETMRKVYKENKSSGN